MSVYYITICGPDDDGRKALLHRITALVAERGVRLTVNDEGVNLDPGLADELEYMHHDHDVYIATTKEVTFVAAADGVIPRTVVGYMTEGKLHKL